MKKSLKKLTGIVMIGVLALGALTGCGRRNASAAKDITIGVCAGPYGDMVKKAIAPSLEKKGYKVLVREFSDYVLPDQALANGEIDANLMQHTAYLEKFAADNDLRISKVIAVPTAGAGIFSDSIKSLKELKKGDKIGIPNDPSNLARALGILDKEKIITLKKNIDQTKASEKDIVKILKTKAYNFGCRSDIKEPGQSCGGCSSRKLCICGKTGFFQGIGSRDLGGRI